MVDQEGNAPDSDVNYASATQVMRNRKQRKITGFYVFFIDISVCNVILTAKRSMLNQWD